MSVYCVPATSKGTLFLNKILYRTPLYKTGKIEAALLKDPGLPNPVGSSQGTAAGS